MINSCLLRWNNHPVRVNAMKAMTKSELSRRRLRKARPGASASEPHPEPSAPATEVEAKDGKAKGEIATNNDESEEGSQDFATRTLMELAGEDADKTDSSGEEKDSPAAEEEDSSSSS